MGRKKNSPPPPPPAANQGGSARRRGRLIPFWQLALLGLSAVLMLGGGAAWAYSRFTDKPSPPTASLAGPTPDGLVSDFGPGSGAPTATRGETPAEPDALDVYSPAVFRLGFSFFAAFAMAYALRQFVKLTLVVVGLALIGLFALQYAGVIKVDWSLVEGKFDSLAAFLKEQTASFTKFVSGYLPSATSAGAGAFIGFRKK